MRRFEKYHPPTVDFDSLHQYEDGPHNADARRELYPFANPPYDIWDDAIKKLYPLEGTETALDIGTGNGIFLDILHNKYGHRGGMLGIDKYPSNYFKSQVEVIQKDPTGPISFMPGDAENIHFKEDSFDIAISGFVNYHVPDPNKALSEMWRVLKPGGKAVVTTRGTDNLERLWRLGGLVADKIGAERPRPFYSHWDIVEADTILPVMFSKVLYREIQDSMLEIPLDIDRAGDRLGWQRFSEALFSLRDNMYVDRDEREKPSEAAVKGVIDTTIWHIFSDEVNRYGHFRLPVHQGVWVLQK
jgi:ubiquinone/menaquinone biosynthesis C-methylase UbiE